MIMTLDRVVAGVRCFCVSKVLTGRIFPVLVFVSLSVKPILFTIVRLAVVQCKQIQNISHMMQNFEAILSTFIETNALYLFTIFF